MRRPGADVAGTAAEVRAEADVLDEALDRLLDPLVELVPRRAHSSSAGTDRLPAIAGEPGGRGTDVIASVKVGTRDLRAGVRPIVRFTVTEPCAECCGRGFPELSTEECGYCGGAGVMEEERLLGLRIPEGVGDGAKLRVRGEGNVPRLGGAPGDLYVHVHVAELRKRPKAPVYAVLAAAVVVLAVLVYLRFFG
jgi:hypothetical protein